MTQNNSAEGLLTETEVSKQLRVSLAALRKWRVARRGPQFLKIGPQVRYRQQDIDLWLASLPVGGEALGCRPGALAPQDADLSGAKNGSRNGRSAATAFGQYQA